MKKREEIISELKPHCPTAEEVVCSDGADQQVMYLDDVADLVEKYEAETSSGTFRQEVAKFAMMGILSNWGKGFAGKSNEIPQMAVEFADALIEQLKQEK